MSCLIASTDVIIDIQGFSPSTGNLVSISTPIVQNEELDRGDDDNWCWELHICEPMKLDEAVIDPDVTFSQETEFCAHKHDKVQAAYKHSELLTSDNPRLWR